MTRGPVPQSGVVGQQRDRGGRQGGDHQRGGHPCAQSGHGTVPDAGTTGQHAVGPPGYRSCRGHRGAHGEQCPHGHGRVVQVCRPPAREAKREAQRPQQVDHEANGGTGRRGDRDRGRDRRRTSGRVDQDHRRVAGHHGQEGNLACPGHCRSREVVGRRIGDAFHHGLDQDQDEYGRVTGGADQPGLPAARHWSPSPADEPGQAGQDHRDRDHVDPVDHDGRVTRRTRPHGPRRACGRRREHGRIAQPVQRGFPDGEPRAADQPGQPVPARRDLGRLDPHRADPGALPGGQQRLGVPQQRHEHCRQPVHGTASAATRPAPRARAPARA